jgi:hypothetical protein
MKPNVSDSTPAALRAATAILDDPDLGNDPMIDTKKIAQIIDREMTKESQDAMADSIITKVLSGKSGPINWYYEIAGGHTNVRVFMNGGKCGDLCFRNEEFKHIMGLKPAGIRFIQDGRNLPDLVGSQNSV